VEPTIKEVAPTAVPVAETTPVSEKDTAPAVQIPEIDSKTAEAKIEEVTLPEKQPEASQLVDEPVVETVNPPSPPKTPAAQYEELVHSNPAELEDASKTTASEERDMVQATAASEPDPEKTPVQSPTSSVYSTAEERSLETVETNDTATSVPELKSAALSPSSSVYSTSETNLKPVEVSPEETNVEIHAAVLPMDEAAAQITRVGTPTKDSAAVEAQLFNEIAAHPYHTPPRTPVRSAVTDFATATVTPATAERYPRMALYDTPTRKQQESKPAMLFPTDAADIEAQLLNEMAAQSATENVENTPSKSSPTERPARRSPSPMNPGAPTFVPGGVRRTPSRINPTAPAFVPRAGRSPPRTPSINPVAPSFVPGSGRNSPPPQAPRGPRSMTGRSSPPRGPRALTTAAPVFAPGSRRVSPARCYPSPPPFAPTAPRRISPPRVYSSGAPPFAPTAPRRSSPQAPMFAPVSGRNSPPRGPRINPAAPAFAPGAGRSSPPRTPRINPAAPAFVPGSGRSSPRINPAAPAFVPGSGRSSPSSRINPAAPAFVPSSTKTQEEIIDQQVFTEATPGSNQLVNAIMHGDISAVQNLLSQPQLDVNAPNEHGQIPAVLALEIFMFAANDNDEILRTLLSRHDLDVNKMHGKDTLLHRAVRYDHEAAVALLLQRRDLDVNAAQSTGATALQLAVVCGYEGVVAQLLRREDLDVNKGSAAGAPIHVAVTRGWKGIIERLVERRDLDVNRVDARGKSPLRLAVDKGAVDIVRVLRGRRDLLVDFR
jgi:hypothetical protein